MKKTAILPTRSVYVKAMAVCIPLTQLLYALPVQTGFADEAFAAAPSQALYKCTWLWNVSSLLQNKDRNLQ